MKERNFQQTNSESNRKYKTNRQSNAWDDEALDGIVFPKMILPFGFYLRQSAQICG